MIRTLLSLLFIAALCTSGRAQQQVYSSQDPAYIDAVTAGAEALNAKAYEECLNYFAEAFKIKTTSYLSTLRAAACAHAAGKVDLRDKYLDHAFSLDPAGSASVVKNYEEFADLQEGPFAEAVAQRYQLAFPDYDAALAERLAEVRRTDQEQRQLMSGFAEKYGWQSPPMDSLWKIQSYFDSVNTEYITALIDEMGYPGKSVVGDQASTAFLVIQHADLAIQEKYLPILREAADTGELRWASLALLIDRIEMRNDRPQIYGSQVSRDPDTGEHFFALIKDPFNIDSIRQTVGLPPLQEYGKNWDIQFDPEKHLARHKALKEDKE